MEPNNSTADGAKARFRPGDRLISAEEARRRRGHSKMTAHRRERDDPAHPKAVYDGVRKFYIEREWDEYLAQLVARSDAGKATTFPPVAQIDRAAPHDGASADAAPRPRRRRVADRPAA